MTMTSLAIFAVAVVACGGDGSGGGTTAPEAGSATITIQSFSFGEPVSISAGDTVTVINKDSTNHTWTSVDDLFNSGPIEPDGEFSFTFDEPGVYEFACRIHPSMKGSLTVTG